MSEFVETYRVVTFVPEQDAQDFIAAVTPQIPHLFGDYDSVAWWSEPKTEHGTEQYREIAEGAGAKHVPSVRMEFSIPKDEALKGQFIAEIITPNHPWESPVILVQTAEILKK